MTDTRNSTSCTAPHSSVSQRRTASGRRRSEAAPRRAPRVPPAAAPASASAASAVTVGCRYMSRIAIGGSVGPRAHPRGEPRQEQRVRAEVVEEVGGGRDPLDAERRGEQPRRARVSVGPDGATNSPAGRSAGSVGGGSAFRSALSLVVIGMTGRCSR